MKLTNMFMAKIPNAFPTRNAIPIAPFATNNHFMPRSDLLAKIGAIDNRAIPMKPYPSAANAQKNEWGLGAANCQSPESSLFWMPCWTTDS